MATATAHEINQPLNVIRLVAVNIQGRLLKGAASPDYLNQKLGRIVERIDRAAAIVDHMRVFGRKPLDTPAPFNLSATLTAAVDFFAETARQRGYSIETRIDDGLTMVGFAVGVEQVVANLLSNAIAALDRTNKGAAGLIRVYETRRDGQAHVEVEDSGGGIPEVLPRIFEPFFTTKPESQGTGLGLSISFGAVRDMGGRLQVANTETGARFYFALPLERPGSRAATRPAAAVA